jgi:glycerol-3-phosphate acyltransferase PlsY
MIVYSILLAVAGYLFGSIPTSYLAGRWVRGIDIRDYGSGTVSGSMAWEHVAHWSIVPVGLFDIVKAALPAWLGIELGGGEVAATVAGLAAVAGHNWSIYLHFKGGRGLSPFLGVLLVVFPAGVPWMLAFLTLGFVLGDSAPWALASLIAMPLLVWVLNGSTILYGVIAVMVLVTLLKRLEANGRPLPTPGGERRRMVVRRLLFDRDIGSHLDWIRQEPGHRQQ